MSKGRKKWGEDLQEFGKMQKARKAELGLPVALWKGTPLPDTSEPHLCAVRSVQTDVY